MKLALNVRIIEYVHHMICTHLKIRGYEISDESITALAEERCSKQLSYSVSAAVPAPQHLM